MKSFPEVVDACADEIGAIGVQWAECRSGGDAGVIVGRKSGVGVE